MESVWAWEAKWEGSVDGPSAVPTVLRVAESRRRMDLARLTCYLFSRLYRRHAEHSRKEKKALEAPRLGSSRLENK